MIARLLAPLLLLAAAPLPDPAIFTDPPHDAAHPARMEVVHIPSGGVEINGLVYIAAGAGPHPVVVLCHGLPGNEKNLDLAQAIRRAGLTVVTFNYRGSWGSPGDYRFGNDLEDARAVLAFVRDPANAARFGFDARRVALVGHSLGAWVSVLTGARDKGVLGVASISGGNIGALGALPRDRAVAEYRDNGMEALAGTSPEIMADESIANRAAFDWANAAPGMAGRPLFVLSSDDGMSPMSESLVTAARGAKLTRLHLATDHSWSDARIRLADAIIGWLRTLS